MQVNFEESKDLLTKYIDEIYYYISIEYPENMELIDESINKYYRLASMRIRLVTSNGMNVQSSIDAILTRIKEACDDEKETIIDTLKNCVDIGSQKYISRKSYQKKKRQIITSSPIAVEVDELLEDSINPYSLERTNDFFRMMFKENELPFIKSKYIKNKEEALMFVSAFIYSGEEEFGYTVELDDGYEETVIASITNMVVRRKK